MWNNYSSILSRVKKMNQILHYCMISDCPSWTIFQDFTVHHPSLLIYWQSVGHCIKLWRHQIFIGHLLTLIVAKLKKNIFALTLIVQDIGACPKSHNLFNDSPCQWPGVCHETTCFTGDTSSLPYGIAKITAYDYRTMHQYPVQWVSMQNFYFF